MILSPHEIAYVVRRYWVDAEDQRIAVAVALAESAGDTDILARSVVGPSIGNRDHGLFQISGRWHGDKLQAKPAWRDPYVNAEIAHQIWTDAGGWSPWAAFNNGSYKLFLPDADIALAHPFPPTLRSS